MRLIFWSFLLAAIVFPAFSAGSLFQSSVAFQCNGICLEGSPIYWNMSLRNIDNRTVGLKQISLSDADGLVFAQWAVIPEKNIHPGNNFLLSASSLVPPPLRGSTLYYRACFDFGKGPECESGWRTLIVMPVSAIQCVESKECQLSSICQTFKCQPLVCPLGSIADNHGCSFVPSAGLVAVLVIVVALIIWRRRK